jgi:peptide/nickel transport system permease protein
MLSMLRTPMHTARSVAPHLAIFLGLAAMLAVLGFNLLGDGLRDVLDPRLRR